MIKADLHNHLGRNGANPGFDETIDVAHSRLGNNGILGILNCEDDRYEKFVDQKGGRYSRVDIKNNGNSVGVFVPEKSFYIFKGQEVFSNVGHLLVIGLPKGKIILYKNLKDIFDQAKEWDGGAIADHTFYKGGINPDEILKFNILGWEVYNASAEFSLPFILPKNANKKSQEFYNSKIKNNYDIGACAFTDGHSVEVLGISYTKLNLEKITLSNLKKAIRANKTFENLHMKPAKWDAFKHAKNMFISNFFKK